MTMFSKISNYMTDLIYETLSGIEPERREVIEYGVYMTVSEIVKISIILLVAVLLNIVPFVFGVIAIYGVLRTFLGGIHAKTHLWCVITHSAIVFGVVAISFMLQFNRYYLLFPIAVFCYITAFKYAPADLPQKPIKSKKQRKQLRIGGFILLTILFALSLVTTLTWSNIILVTCFVQTFFLTPFAYKVSGNKYGREEASA